MRRSLAALALVALATSCSSGDDASPATSATTTTAAASPLAFTAPTVGGGELDLADYAGRDVALWFWAPY
jgi:hypothetical protein